MQRHRCTKCRNPIRGIAVSGPGAAASDWYHSDCWADVRASGQRDYEENVRSGGLSALLAPYFHARSAPAPD